MQLLLAHAGPSHLLFLFRLNRKERPMLYNLLLQRTVWLQGTPPAPACTSQLVGSYPINRSIQWTLLLSVTMSRPGSAAPAPSVMSTMWRTKAAMAARA